MKNSTSRQNEIPSEILELLTSEIDGIDHGIVKLEISIRDKHIQRFLISRDQSFLASDIRGGVE